MSSHLANVIKKAMFGQDETPAEAISRDRIIQSELVEEASRESIWRLFSMINERRRINQEMSPAHFQRVWEICDCITAALEKYEDWPNLARFIYNTQKYRTYRSTGDQSCTNKYLLKTIIGKPEFLVEALCTLIEVTYHLIRTMFLCIIRRPDLKPTSILLLPT